METQAKNIAYDFELFEDKENNIVNIEDSERFRKNKAHDDVMAKKAAAKSKAINLILIGIVIALLCAGLYTRGLITEVKDEINTVKKEISTLDSDIIRLNMELESAVSFETLAEDAQKLGMCPKEKSQTIYITLNNEDKAEVLNVAEEGFFDSIKTAFAK